jgi:hypothetical protein
MQSWLPIFMWHISFSLSVLWPYCPSSRAITDVEKMLLLNFKIGEFSRQN